MRTKLLVGMAFFCVFALVASVGPASAVIITVDENGNGTLDLGLGPFPLPGVLLPDPTPEGLTVPVLTYVLPFPVVFGDLVLLEPGSTNEYSDVIRFFNTSLIFYSDISTSDPPDALADTGLPINIRPVIFIPEIGPEGDNGVTYVAPSGTPGSLLSGEPVTYVIVSDSPTVPEPATILIWSLLGATWAGGLAVVRRRRPWTPEARTAIVAIIERGRI